MPVSRLQGGSLAAVTIDTNQLLEGPLQGTIVIEEVRIAGQAPGGSGGELRRLLRRAGRGSLLRAQLEVELPPQAKAGDSPVAPLVVALADLGATAGGTLRLERVGTYADLTVLKNGTDTALSGGFSATSEVKAANQKTRVPGAVEAGPNVKTGYLKCLIFPLCVFVSTDVPQDFPVAAQTEVVVPAGAQYLVLAPLSPAYAWSDNSGFSFGVDVTVNPTP